MRASLRTTAIIGLSLTLGCTIIIRPENNMNGPPVPIPLACNPDVTAPTAHVIFVSRVEKTTVNLAEHYASFMTSTVLMLAGAGLNPTNAVLLRGDERPIESKFMGAWGCTTDSPDVLAPSEVIRHYALTDPPEEAPLGCMTDTVTDVAKAMPDLITLYPPELRGTNNVRVFSNRPDVLLVVHLDALERRTGFGDGECDSATDILARNADGTAAWVGYSDAGMAMSEIVHWFVATDEGIDRDAFVSQCRSFEAFPTDVLDVMEPSARQLYMPLADQIRDGGGHATFLSVCEMLGADRAFFEEQASLIGGIVGLEVDTDKVIDTIQNGPNVDQGGEIPETIPPG